MPSPDELEKKFWNALTSDMTVMLGRDGGDYPRPMTAQIEDERGPIWFFTSRDTEIVQKLEATDPALFTFASKGHDLFATVRGTLQVHNDRSTIDRLWNPFVAAWFEDGKDDPKLVLLRFDADEAEIWLNENSLFAGIKMLFGIDPKEDYKDKVATVDLAGS
jgi:general stress protein 26